VSDAFDNSPTDATAPKDEKATKGQRGPKRRSMFGLGIFVGLALGIAGTIVVPDLFPTPEPDCTRPDRIEWSVDATDAVSLDIDQGGDGTDACNVTVVFTEPATASG